MSTDPTKVLHAPLLIQHLDPAAEGHLLAIFARSTRRLSIAAVVALISLSAAMSAVEAVKPLQAAQVLTHVKKFLAERNDEKKQEMVLQAGDLPADPAILIKALASSNYAAEKSGVMDNLKLVVPASVSDKPTEYSLKIPAKYAPTHLWPLIIGLHGGGDGSGSGAQHMGTMRDVEDAILVCPTSVDLGIQAYWRNPKNEAMLKLLVQELCRRFPIDPDRVYLSGYSMGGFGVYYLGPRLCERFAAVAPGGGGWSVIFWRQLLNTPVYVWHGRRDLRGDMFTNYPYAEHAAECLTEADCPHELHTMESGHGDFPSTEFKVMSTWLLTKKRDAYPKHIVHASPCAKDFSVDIQPAPADRWLTIDRIGDSLADMESVTFGGATRTKTKIPFGLVDAVWTGANVLEATQNNVKSFRVFLSPKLMDFKKPLRVVVNGTTVFDGMTKSSLGFAMRYIDDHRDPGMVYVAEQQIDLDAPGVAPSK